MNRKHNEFINRLTPDMSLEQARQVLREMRLAWKDMFKIDAELQKTISAFNGVPSEVKVLVRKLRNQIKGDDL